jgi:hypothetical protein
MKQNFDFKLLGRNIEVVDTYSYLGWFLNVMGMY